MIILGRKGKPKLSRLYWLHSWQSVVLLWILFLCWAMYYFTQWYGRPTLVEPWHLSTRITLSCVLCNKVSGLLQVWDRLHSFFYDSNLISSTQANTNATQIGTNILKHKYYIITPPAMWSQQLSVLHWISHLLM